MMKNLLICLLIGLPLLLNAQALEGEIIFEETAKFEIELPEGQEHLLAMIPSTQTSKKVLHFNATESIYLESDGSDADNYTEENTTEGNVQMKMVIMRPEHKIYKNLADKSVVQLREFMGKKFLIKEEIEASKWKLTSEEKQILNYTCRKATYQDEENTVEAWFTTELPLSNGPDNFGQLPGMILEVNMNEGKLQLLAKEVKLTPQSAKIIKAPKKGKKVSREDFEAIVEQKTKEMEEEMGGSGMQINIRN